VLASEALTENRLRAPRCNEMITVPIKITLPLGRGGPWFCRSLQVLITGHVTAKGFVCRYVQPVTLRTSYTSPIRVEAGKRRSGEDAL
jgi:hypothetical protein